MSHNELPISNKFLIECCCKFVKPPYGFLLIDGQNGQFIHGGGGGGGERILLKFFLERKKGRERKY